MSAATGNILTNPPYFFEKLNPPTFVVIIYMAPIHIWPTTSRSASNFCGPRKCTQHGPRASHMTTTKAHGRAHAFAGQLCLLHRIAITLLTFLQLAASLVNPPFQQFVPISSLILTLVCCRISTYFLRLKSALQTLFRLQTILALTRFIQKVSLSITWKWVSLVLLLLWSSFKYIYLVCIINIDILLCKLLNSNKLEILPMHCTLYNYERNPVCNYISFNARANAWLQVLCRRLLWIVKCVHTSFQGGTTARNGSGVWSLSLLWRLAHQTRNGTHKVAHHLTQAVSSPPEESPWTPTEPEEAMRRPWKR